MADECKANARVLDVSNDDDETAAEEVCNRFIDAMAADVLTRRVGPQHNAHSAASTTAMILLSTWVTNRSALAKSTAAVDAARADSSVGTTCPVSWLVAHALASAIPRCKVDDFPHLVDDTMSILDATTYPALQVRPWRTDFEFKSADRDFISTTLRDMPLRLPWARLVRISCNGANYGPVIANARVPTLELRVSAEDVSLEAPVDDVPAAAINAVRELIIGSNQVIASRTIIGIVDGTCRHHGGTFRTLQLQLAPVGLDAIMRHIAGIDTLDSLAVTSSGVSAVGTELFRTIPEVPPVMQRLKSLSLTGGFARQGLGTGNINTLFRARNFAVQVTHLTLNGCGIQTVDAYTIATALDSDAAILPSLSHLALPCNSIADRGIEALMTCQRIVAGGRFVALDVRSNPFSEQACYHALEAFAASKTMRCLQLHPAGSVRLMSRLRSLNIAKGGGPVM
jgi:hypothetical protein